MTDTPLTPITSNTYPQAPISGYGENSDEAPPAEAPAETEAERLPRADGKISCRMCGGWVKASYMQAHMVKMHDIGRKREFKPRVNGNGKGKHKGKAASKPGPKPAAPKPVLPYSTSYDVVPVADDPLTVDGILATLVELRWPVSMPTRKVLEMVELRAALAKFLA